MDCSFGRRVVDTYNREGGTGNLRFTPDAGHQVFMCNPDGFNRHLFQCVLGQ